MQTRAEYLATLPRRRITAGALIRDATGSLCLVNPTYTDHWDLPGGTVEADESPSEGCRRELREELGLEINIGRMLCMDWISPADHGDAHGALEFIYDGGVLDQPTIDMITTPPDELHGFRFVAVPELDAYLDQRNRRLIEASLSVITGANDAPLELDREPAPCAPEG